VRKALSYAIERDRIVRIAMQGYTRTADATALSDLYAKYHDPKVLEEEGDWTKYNPEKAAAMLDAAGLKRGKDGYRKMVSGHARWRVATARCVGPDGRAILAQFRSTLISSR
jgi:peptide/nickel transport system substrate-binding protein